MACKNVHSPIDNTCPTKVAVKTIKKIDSSSTVTYFKKNKQIFRQTMGNCNNTTKINGPGDSVSSVQKINGNKYTGVDKKHGSYARYLAAKVHKCV